MQIYPPVSELPTRYNSDPLKGLTSKQVEINRQQYGSNELSPIKGIPLWRQFLEKFKDNTIIILCVAAVVSLLIGFYTGHFLDGIAILSAVFVATTVGFYNEYKSNKEFELLNRMNDDIRAKVTRNSQFQTIPIGQLVVGDIIHLESGDKISADAKLLHGIELNVNQSLMTGESEPVLKNETDLDLFRGTTVTDGSGVAIIAAVGDSTELGKIKEQLVEDPTPTPLQEKLNDLADKIGKVGTIAAVLIFVALTGVALYSGDLKLDMRGLELVIQFFIVAVTVVVVAVPEGLPLAVTVSLAFSMRRIAKDNNLVRKLSACETIGSATVICSDKTGTLTKNQMVVQRILLGGKAYSTNEFSYNPQDPSCVRFALNSAVNSTGNLEGGDGQVQFVGNPTECALLAFLREKGTSYETLREERPVVQRISFSSLRKLMVTVTEDDGRYIILVKGAPEKVIPSCTQYEAGHGAMPIGDHLDAINRELDHMSSEAMRTLALAYKHVSSLDDMGSLDKDLTLLALVGIADPLRDDVKDAVLICKRAGIDVKMVTGDSVKTATVIANQLGLLGNNKLVVDGGTFKKMSDEELMGKAPHLGVLARVEPLDKLRLVTILKSMRHVVAVTGDGTNDAPALKQADVGLSMGRSGTEIAKEASDIVLLDDSFSSIMHAVKWGRSLYENIQKFIQFQLTVNVAALAVAFFGALFGFGLPLTTIQLLWVNLIMDTLAALALGLEPPTDDVMNKPPKRRDEPIITSQMWTNILFMSSYFFIVLMLLLKFNILGGQTPREAETIVFTVFVFFQIWNEINCRSLDPLRSCFTGITRNRYFLGIVGLIVIVQVLLTQFGGEVFRTTSLSFEMWMKIILLTSTALVLSELRRFVRRVMERSNKPEVAAATK